MDQVSQDKLQEILGKEILALTNGEREFLRARRGYLTEVQKEVFSEILEEKTKTPEPITEVIDSNTSTLSYRNLQKKARGYGLKYVGVGRDDLLRQIDTIEGPGGADKPL